MTDLVLFIGLLFVVSLTWAGAITLVNQSRKHWELRVLRERATVAVAVALGLTMFLIVFVDILLTDIVAGEIDKWLGVVALYLMGSPNIWWLYLYKTNGFKDDDVQKLK